MVAGVCSEVGGEGDCRGVGAGASWTVSQAGRDGGGEARSVADALTSLPDGAIGPLHVRMSPRALLGLSRGAIFTRASRRLARLRSGVMDSNAVASGRAARTAGAVGISLEAATTISAPLARWAARSSPDGQPAVVVLVLSGGVR